MVKLIFNLIKLVKLFNSLTINSYLFMFSKFKKIN